MLKNKNRVLFIITVWLISCSALVGQQNFSDFFIDFLRDPETQFNYVQFPLKTDNNTVKNKASYHPVTFLSRNHIPVICADSLNAIMQFPSPIVSIFQFGKDVAASYVFEQRNKNWKLISSKNENIQQLQEAEFLNFLTQYSNDESFQMKHTIFPFPSRIYNSPKRHDSEPENKLLMPREWNSLDFTAIFPSLCIFNSNNQAPNRQIHVFRNGKAAQLFNFIRINKKWYLIEIEEYK
ncbi:MAG: DUF4348 domain-containing protein [Prevotellaceae bacterium]|jgi:hypothetical protein|nr:DUF4348 domain-containing protein [Prevotellaceae bacterium]